jgi:ACR3 family arsenite transporter
MINQIGPVLRVTVPLVLYFSIVWIATFYLSSLCNFPIQIAITQSFTCGSNNFELAMAVAIAIYGVDSQQALATTIGPLVEVPVLIGLVYLTPYVAKVMYNENH